MSRSDPSTEVQTGGALFFQNTRIVAARAARGAGSSYLVDFGGTPPIAEIGDHRF